MLAVVEIFKARRGRRQGQRIKTISQVSNLEAIYLEDERRSFGGEDGLTKNRSDDYSKSFQVTRIAFMTQSRGDLAFKISLRGTTALMKTKGVRFEARRVAPIALWLCISSGVVFAQNSAADQKTAAGPAGKSASTDSFLQPVPVIAADSSHEPSSTSVVSTTALANSESGPEFAPVWAASSETNTDLPAPASAEPFGANPGTDPQTQQAPADSAIPASNQEPPRRALPAPLDPIFPSSEYFGPTPAIGIPDTDPVYPLEKELYKIAPFLQRARIKIYGWANPGVDASSSSNSNIPESYAIVPNRIELDQGVVRFERVPDTVQTDHVDWGFRATTIYGIDYRWTTSQGWFSGQLLKNNYLYGVDPVEMYFLLYFPHVAQGMVIKLGRYISPPDIEAQLAPDNFLFTHSLMFTEDCYTQTGINAQVKLNDYWTILFGIHAGDDIAPWNPAAHNPTGMAFVRWVSHSNNDSVYVGIDSINDGRFRAGHDNLQQDNLTWTHRFTEKGTFFTSTEAYYIYQSGALVGGTVNNGPPRPWFEGVGPGAYIPGNSPAIGFVNYTEWKFAKDDFLSVRPLDILVDEKGERTGFPTTYESWTVGVTHRFLNGLISLRPEVRYEYAYGAKPYDNGTSNHQLMFAGDAIIRF